MFGADKAAAAGAGGDGGSPSPARSPVQPRRPGVARTPSSVTTELATEARASPARENDGGASERGGSPAAPAPAVNEDLNSGEAKPHKNKIRIDYKKIFLSSSGNYAKCKTSLDALLRRMRLDYAVAQRKQERLGLAPPSSSSSSPDATAASPPHQGHHGGGGGGGSSSASDKKDQHQSDKEKEKAKRGLPPPPGWRPRGQLRAHLHEHGVRKTFRRFPNTPLFIF